MKVQCLQEVRNDKKKDMVGRIRQELREEIGAEIISEIVVKVNIGFYFIG
jgi:hypothetical protein